MTVSVFIMLLPFYVVILPSLSATFILEDSISPPIVNNCRRRTNLTLLSLFITLAAFAVSGNAVAPLISTLSASIGVPASSFGYIITLQFMAFALASFLGGAIKERLRLSNFHLVSAGLLIISVSFFLGALVLRSAAALILWVAPLGLAGGFVETFSSVQISRLSRAGSSKNLCLSQVFYTIGALAAPQIVYIIFGAGLNWRSAFVIFGLFTTSVCVFFLLFNLRRGGFGQQKDAPAGAAPAGAAPAVPVRGSIFSLLVLLMLSVVLLESFSASWLAYIFELRYALTARDASLILVLFWAGVMTGRLLVLLLPVRWTLWPTLVVSAVALLIAAVCLAAVHSLRAQHVFVALLGVFLGPLWPAIVMTSSSTFASEKSTSNIIGIGALGFGSGPLLGPLVLGMHWTAHFFLVHLALAALIVVFCLITWRAHARIMAIPQRRRI
jgi:fucose permease